MSSGTSLLPAAPVEPVKVCTSAEGREALLERILQNPSIPSPPALALRVFQATANADCDVEEISKLLAHDPGLCARMLKALNSVFYGLSHTVTSVRQAVTIVGNRGLRSLVMGLALPAMQAGLKPDAGLRKFWKESLAGAVMARELAKYLLYPNPDEDLTASLLRDVGMLLLRQAFQDSYDPIWTGQDGLLPGQQCAWEERHLGIHHAEVGAALLERWNLPIEIVEPIRFHHHPELLPPLVKSLADRIALLDFTSRLAQLEQPAGSVPHPPYYMEGILQIACQRFGFQPLELEHFLGTVRPKIEEFSGILRVDIGACPNFDQLLRAAARNWSGFRWKLRLPRVSNPSFPGWSLGTRVWKPLI